MHCGELTTGARLMVWELTQWVSDEDDVCALTQRTIAKTLGAHRNSVIRWFKELRAKGILVDEPGGGYSLHLNAIAKAETAEPVGR
jgi:transposase